MRGHTQLPMVAPGWMSPQGGTAGRANPTTRLQDGGRLPGLRCGDGRAEGRATAASPGAGLSRPGLHQPRTDGAAEAGGARGGRNTAVGPRRARPGSPDPLPGCSPPPPRLQDPPRPDPDPGPRFSPGGRAALRGGGVGSTTRRAAGSGRG